MRPLAVAAALVACFVGRAWALDDVAPPRSIAIGGGGRADATGSLGPLLNPAGMALEKRIYLDASYGFTVQGLGSALYVSVVDSTTNAHVAAGLYYSFVDSSPRIAYAGSPTTAHRQGNEWGTSLALPFGDRFAIGLTTKYVRASTEVANPNAALPMQPMTLTLDSSTNGATADGFTADFGFVFRILDALNVAACGYNLIPV